jgi:hypothetical protein
MVPHKPLFRTTLLLDGGKLHETIWSVLLYCCRRPAMPGMLVRSPQVRAQNDNNQGNQGNQVNDDESKIKRGFEIAPVPLNLEGKNRALVGLGSYIVNAQAGCNGVTPSDPQSNIYLREIHICFRRPSAER